MLSGLALIIRSARGDSLGMDPQKQVEGVGDEGFHSRFVKSEHWKLEWALPSLACLEHSATQFLLN